MIRTAEEQRAKEASIAAMRPIRKASGSIRYALLKHQRKGEGGPLYCSALGESRLPIMNVTVNMTARVLQVRLCTTQATWVVPTRVWAEDFHGNQLEVLYTAPEGHRV